MRTTCPKHLLPERFGRSITIGESLYVRNYIDIEREAKNNLVRCGWDSSCCRHVCGREIILDERMIERMRDERDEILRCDRVTLSLDMLETKEEHQIYLDRLETLRQIRYQSCRKFPVLEQDEDIIAEMIKKVDISRFMNVLSIMGAIRRDEKYFVTKDKALEYLRRWAEAKYDFYILFNKELTISNSVEFKINDCEFERLINETCEKYPEHAFTLLSFNSDEWMQNEFWLRNHRRFTNVLPQFAKDKMKLTKFLSQLIKNNELDIDLSKIYQISSIKGKVVASIDPYDYLTMSLNQHDWSSCHNIADGCYATGAASYLCDDTTIIGYRSNDKNYHYRVHDKFKFSGNSKSWRQCVYVDKHTASSIFGRQYPNQTDGMSDALMNLVTSQIDDFVNDDTSWDFVEKDSNVAERFFNVSNLHYSDVNHNHPFTLATKSSVPNIKNIIEWQTGSKHVCIRCGNEITEQGYSLVCNQCRNS